MIRKILPLLVLLFAINSSTSAQTPVFTIEDMQYGMKYKNVAYDRLEDKNKTMDVYLAKYAHSATPFVVLIHDGLYEKGSKNNMQSLAEKFMAENISVMALDYRKVSNAAFSEKTTTYVEILTDIWRAMQFANQNANDWRFTPNNFTLFGEGAGAHLALLAAHKFHESVKSVIAVTPITDLRQLPALEKLAGSRNKTRTLFTKLVGNVPFSLKNPLPYVYLDASPILQVKNVPTLLMHDRYNTIIPFSQSESMYNALRDANVTARLVTMEGGKTNLVTNSVVENMAWAEVLYWLKKNYNY